MKKINIKEYKWSEFENLKLIIPSFQRTLIWNEKELIEFYKTLYEQRPFGALTIWEKDEKMFLIDGLQRISSIKKIFSNPFKYLTTDFLKIKI